MHVAIEPSLFGDVKCTSKYDPCTGLPVIVTVIHVLSSDTSNVAASAANPESVTLSTTRPFCVMR